ncbi:hypothetical protein [Legionella worsleiensis]|uniref:Uncharacterized protein n=1 Tax=Legionella worsleiensis TaxID=45076 RepID=A0A0W1AKP1_9GAMM|nr:hypothetical protein [Legionella worsleiensis]KTD81895.1 hypothetical protein Lwor_0198 [Legionella worsleiensis]STY31200.1 Uncharacterised protein [Legionella worsleiensis]
MPKTIKLHRTSEYAPIPLVKNEQGLYPVPTMRCGILPYTRQGSDILWGCVKSNRVGPVTITLPAGIQDILVTKGEKHLALEVGKPVPDLGYECVQEFVGTLFRDQVYQQMVSRLIENDFNVFIEHPLVTALHETREEHGIDLRKDEGRDHHLLHQLIELAVQPLSGQRGATAQMFWIASLNALDGIELSNTAKIEKKIRRNFGREFYEQGCWGTLPEFKKALIEARQHTTPTPHSASQTDLIKGVLEAYEETLDLLSYLELLINNSFIKTALPREFPRFFTHPSERTSDDAGGIDDMLNTVLRSTLREESGMSLLNPDEQNDRLTYSNPGSDSSSASSSVR